MRPLLAMLLLLAASPVPAADWITAPSYFTHDPTTGQRVQQYAPIGPFYVPGQSDFVRSGFRHTRSSIQVGTSADHYHTTEEWGRPIQPYGEWRFPYRPYSVPYPAWGPPIGGWGPGFGGRFPAAGGAGGLPFGWHGGFPPGVLPRGGAAAPELEPGFGVQQQLLDGRYPPFDELSPFERQQAFDHLYPPPDSAPAPP